MKKYIIKNLKLKNEIKNKKDFSNFIYLKYLLNINNGIL